jgi:hypothetical protein
VTGQHQVRPARLDGDPVVSQPLKIQLGGELLQASRSADDDQFLVSADFAFAANRQRRAGDLGQMFLQLGRGRPFHRRRFVGQADDVIAAAVFDQHQRRIGAGRTANEDPNRKNQRRPTRSALRSRIRENIVS